MMEPVPPPPLPDEQQEAQQEARRKILALQCFNHACLASQLATSHCTQTPEGWIVVRASEWAAAVETMSGLIDRYTELTYPGGECDCE